MTLAEVMSEGVNSTVGDRATGKLMSHIKALQEKVREGGSGQLSETMLAEQARLREEAEEAKFYATRRRRSGKTRRISRASCTSSCPARESTRDASSWIACGTGRRR